MVRAGRMEPEAAIRNAIQCNGVPDVGNAMQRNPDAAPPSSGAPIVHVGAPRNYRYDATVRLHLATFNMLTRISKYYCWSKTLTSCRHEPRGPREEPHDQACPATDE